jgi:spore coat protein CotF
MAGPKEQVRGAEQRGVGRFKFQNPKSQNPKIPKIQNQKIQTFKPFFNSNPEHRIPKSDLNNDVTGNP